MDIFVMMVFRVRFGLKVDFTEQKSMVFFSTYGHNLLLTIQ